MKEKIEYRYEFANGEVVELRISRSGAAGEEKNGISSEWLELLFDLDRREYNNNQTETRRHCSLNAMDQDDNQIAIEKDAFADFYEEETWKEMCKALTERERLIGDLFFRQGYKQKELAMWHWSIEHTKTGVSGKNQYIPRLFLWEFGILPA